jgi:glycine/D-amino acid oxidase-like deaminating enzyme
MTASTRGDVVIVGGGIVGMVTAYYLAKAGVPSVVIERDAIGSHASGYAYGGLSPVTGFGIPGPLAEVAQAGMRLHRELAWSVVEETGIGIDFRVRSSLALAFTEADVQRLQSALPWQQRCGSGFWGGQRPSLAHYVTGMGPMDGATAAGGRSCCLSSRRCPQSFPFDPCLRH